MPDDKQPADEQPVAADEGDDSEEALEVSLRRLREHIDAFLNDYLEGKSKETVGTYRRSLNEFQRWFVQQNGGFRFRTDGVRRYKKYLMETRELSQVSVSTYLTAVRRLCQYLVDRGDLTENPATAVKGNRRPDRHTRQVLTETDIEALMEMLDAGTRIGKRDRGIVFLMLRAGLAEIEIVRADVGDLEQTLMGWFLRVQGKGQKTKDQRVPLDPPVIEAVQTYLDAREDDLDPDSPLFVSHGHRSAGQRLNTRSVRSRINTHLKDAGIKRKGVTPHSLTHTAPLIWLNRGMDVEEVKNRMRHGTLDTTMIYFKKQGLLKRDPDELSEIEG
jgi:site-specific recombinase XerD